MMELKVTNSLNDVMFVANVSYIYVSAFIPHIKPYVSGMAKVEPGDGNCGDALEYLATYNGNAISYPNFVKLMNNIDI